MKLNKIFSALMLIAAVAFTACEGQQLPPDGPNGPDQPNTPTQGLTYAEDEISVSAMLAQGAQMASGDTLDFCKVKGIVKTVENLDVLPGVGYGNAEFVLTETGTEELLCYRIKGLDNEKFVDFTQLVEGDTVTVYARLYNYKGEKLEMIKGYLTYTSNPKYATATAPVPQAISLAEVATIGATLESGETTTALYILEGDVDEVTDASTQYGNCTFYITDGTDRVECYRLKYIDNKKYDGSKVLEVGDHVKVVGQIQRYKDSYELKNGYIMEHTK